MAADEAPLARVLRAIALARTPGFNLPGYFLGVSFDEVAHGRARVSMDAGAHNADAAGEAHVGAVALLADMALAASLRSEVGVAARTATVAMSLQFHAAPRTGRLEAAASCDGFVASGAERQGLARVEVRGDAGLACTGSGTFMVLGAATAHPLPRRDAAREVELPEPSALEEAEALVYRRALAAARGDKPFIEAFWGYAPRATRAGASASAPNGPHIGNRVGHAQGGVTFGLAAATAQAALPRNWGLVGASAWYVGPGTGSKLRVRARVVHRGMLTAVVSTRIENDEGRAVLLCTSSHARRSGV